MRFELAGRFLRSPHSEVILEAVRERAWLPEQIEGVSSKYALENHPPPLEGVESWVDAKIDRKAKGTARTKAKGETNMAAACQKARNRAAYPIDAWAGRARLPLERSHQRGGIDVMQQGRELRLARASGRRIHTLEIGQQGLPAPCLALRRLLHDPFQPTPSLLHVVSFHDLSGSMGRSDFQQRCSERLRSSLAACPRR